MTAEGVFFGALLLFGIVLAVLHFVISAKSGSSMSLLHQVLFFWHKRHIFFLRDGQPQGDAFCVICNIRLRYVQGVSLKPKPAERTTT
jgi:hypothetical protein